MKLRYRGAVLALAVLLTAPAAFAATKAKPAARGNSTVCIDPALHGEAGPVCRIACAGFFIDVRSGARVFFAGRDFTPGRIWTYDGKLNGEGKFTAVSVLGNAATACALTGFDLNGPINPALRR